MLPVGWKISEDAVVQPDNLVVCGDVTTEAYLDRPPLLVFEVLSPPHRAERSRGEVGVVCGAGGRCYVLVDPERLQAEGMELEGGAYRLRATLREGVWHCDLGECEITFEFGRIWRV